MRTFLILSFLICAFSVNGQSANDKIDSLEKKGVTAIEIKNTFDASLAFEKILSIDPNNINALYQMALIDEQLQDQSSAIRMLRRGMALNDRRSTKRLIEKYKIKVSYADTMQTISNNARQRYSEIKKVRFGTFRDLTSKILSLTPNKKDQLQLLLLWCSENMQADSARFFDPSEPLTNAAAFTKRIGLCDEFTNLTTEFCKAAGIKSYRVSGYVKYFDFIPGTTFTETNHTWNAVYIESSWYLCDLFWSITALQQTTKRFKKILETEYFLGRPQDFLYTHLPADPVFQFSNHPITLTSFSKNKIGLDTTVQRMKYVNFADSLAALSKMPMNEQQLRIARRSYQYNPANPNDFIGEAYNYAVDIVNNNSSSKISLQNARAALLNIVGLIKTSSDRNIITLRDRSIRGIDLIDRKMKTK